MKSFESFLSEHNEQKFIEALVLACEEHHVDLAKCFEQFLEQQIALEHDEAKLAVLMQMYSEGIMSGLGNMIGQGINNFKQGYQQGMYGNGSAAGPEQQMKALYNAYAQLQRVGMGDQFEKQFQQLYQQLSQQAGPAQQQQAQQPNVPSPPNGAQGAPPKASNNAMDMSRLSRAYQQQQRQAGDQSSVM